MRLRRRREPLEIVLELPSDLGAEVLSKSRVNNTLHAASDIHVTWRSPPSEDVERTSSYHDLGATLLVVAGTAVAGKAVAGIFDVLKVVIQEAHATMRQRQQHEHERAVLRLKLGARIYDFDLDRPLSDLEADLEDAQPDA
jgi:hypothetical protein